LVGCRGWWRRELPPSHPTLPPAPCGNPLAGQLTLESDPPDSTLVWRWPCPRRLRGGEAPAGPSFLAVDGVARGGCAGPRSTRRASNAPESSGPCAQPIGRKSPSRGQPACGVVGACGRCWRGAGVARQVERGASLEHCRSERTEAPAAARRRAGAARRRCWSQRAGAEGRSVGELVAGRGGLPLVCAASSARRSP
jgi:hypothetical protein